MAGAAALRRLKEDRLKLSSRFPQPSWRWALALRRCQMPSGVSSSATWPDPAAANHSARQLRWASPLPSRRIRCEGSSRSPRPRSRGSVADALTVAPTTLVAYSL